MDFVRKHRRLMVIALFAVMATCCANECSDFIDAVSDLLSDGYSLDIAVTVAGAKVVALSNSSVQQLSRPGGAQTDQISTNPNDNIVLVAGGAKYNVTAEILTLGSSPTFAATNAANENGPASAYGQSSDDRTECRAGADCRR